MDYRGYDATISAVETRLNDLERSATVAYATAQNAYTDTVEIRSMYDQFESTYVTKAEYAATSSDGIYGYYNGWPIVTYRNGILYADEEPLGPLPIMQSPELSEFWDGIEVHK